jgi:hypothetical protein
LNPLIEAEGEPQVNSEFGSYYKQESWLRLRDETTAMTHLRNNFLAQGLPAFTPTGFKVVDIPAEAQEWLLDFYERNSGGSNIRFGPGAEARAARSDPPAHRVTNKRKTEVWSSGRTQTNAHSVPFTFIDLDLERAEANRMADKYFKPILEEWANVTGLELTSFYGVREYYPDNILKNHIDRISTHVISATLCLGKLNEDFTVDTSGDEHAYWPIEGLDWNGTNIRYEHPPGKMVLYESAKFVHGRPYANPKGLHVGAFLHYVPPANWGTWTERSEIGEKFMEDNYVSVRWESTPIVEPKNPVYTEYPFSKVLSILHLRVFVSLTTALCVVNVMCGDHL